MQRLTDAQAAMGCVAAAALSGLAFSQFIVPDTSRDLGEANGIQFGLTMQNFAGHIIPTASKGGEKALSTCVIDAETGKPIGSRAQDGDWLASKSELAGKAAVVAAKFSDTNRWTNSNTFSFAVNEQQHLVATPAAEPGPAIGTITAGSSSAKGHCLS